MKSARLENSLFKSLLIKPTNFRQLGLYLSMIFMVVALSGIFSRGLNLGIDFTGGFITEFSTSESIGKVKMQSIIDKHVAEKYQLTTAEAGTLWIVRQSDAGDTTSIHWLEAVDKELSAQFPGLEFTLLDSDFIDTQIGEELIDQGGLAMLTALIIILMYLSSRFEWRFALGAILALAHDIIFVIGVFAWSGVEFNLTVLASLLAIVGYSLNDSIIVADRIRELMHFNKINSLSEIIDAAVKSTMTRTLITSGTTLTTISAVWLLAGEPLQGFSVALFSGVFVGTFSSICIAATFPELTGMDVEHYKKRELEKSELATEV